MEGAEQVGGDGVPDPQLSGSAPVEEGADVGAVGALRGCGEPEEFAGLEVVEKPPIGRRLGVVELVDDDDVERVGGDLGDAAGERLDAGEDVSPLARDVPADIQLAEGAVAEDLAVGAQRLLEDLLAVGDEEQARPFAPCTEAAIVEGGDDGLAGAGCGDDEVAVPVVQGAFGVEGLKDLLLMRVGPHVKAGDEEARRGAAALRCLHGAFEPLAVGVVVGVVGRVFVRMPVGLEGRGELVEEARGRDRGEADVPLRTVEEGAGGEVRGADVGSVEAGVAAEEPALGVQPRPARVVLDPDVGAEVAGEAVEGLDVGAAEVGRGDDPESRVAVFEAFKLGLEGAHAMPLHKRADEVDLVAGVELRLDLAAQTRVAVGIGEECDVGEWGARADAFGIDGGQARHGGLREGKKATDAIVRTLLLGVEEVEHAADEGEAGGFVRVGRYAQGLEDRVAEVSGEHIRLVGGIDVVEVGREVGTLRQSAQQRGRDHGLV